MNQYYTYIYHDENMLPYYVGKGCRGRATENHGSIPVPPKARIVIQYWESETEAFEMEMWWIALFGRKCLGTGLLLNEGEGGRGISRRSCAKGGKIGGKTTARLYFTLAHQSAAGTKNVESGHIFRIASPEASARMGRLAVESGRIFTIATKESCAKGGQTAGQVAAKRGYLPSISAKGNHVQHHINRGLIKAGCPSVWRQYEHYRRTINITLSR